MERGSNSRFSGFLSRMAQGRFTILKSSLYFTFHSFDCICLIVASLCQDLTVPAMLYRLPTSNRHFFFFFSFSPFSTAIIKAHASSILYQEADRRKPFHKARQSDMEPHIPGNTDAAHLTATIDHKEPPDWVHWPIGATGP